MASSRSFYTVIRGDTLSAVASRHHTTVEELCAINDIKNPDKLEVGQVLALNRKAVCKVSVLLIDRDRNPIPGGKLRLEYSGKKKIVRSRKNGRAPEIITASPLDVVAIFIERTDKSWKKVAEVCSGWGNKLVTVQSPKLRIESETKHHPKDQTGNPVPDPPKHKTPVVPSADPKTTKADGRQQADYGDGKGVKTKAATTSAGLPTSKASNDQARLDFLTGYVGGEVSEKDYELAAKDLGCEVKVIKAIAKVESGGISGFDKKQRPVIHYERHLFSRFTDHKYDDTNADISARTKYKILKKGVKASREELKCSYSSSSSEENYRRLAKAYALNKDAAIKACSWGKFQILGANYRDCGYATLSQFVADEVKNDAAQLHAFVMFIKSIKLQSALEKKDWAKIARGYNGKYYKQFNYDERIKEAYEEL